MTHTPGPWLCGLANAGDGYFEIEAPALPVRKTFGGDEWSRPFIVEYVKNPDDISLIIAAPAMLDLLKQIRDAWRAGYADQAKLKFLRRIDDLVEQAQDTKWRD